MALCNNGHLTQNAYIHDYRCTSFFIVLKGMVRLVKLQVQVISLKYVYKNKLVGFAVIKIGNIES